MSDGSGPPGDSASRIAVARQILEACRLDPRLGLDPPPEVARHLDAARRLLERVREVVGPRGHGEYFDASGPRYVHAFAAAMELPPGSRVLDVGNAPGHVGIGLHLIGLRVTGVNASASWRETYPSPDWLRTFDVVEVDLEREPLPYAGGAFDAVLFTEVLEHIAVKDPVSVLEELRRVLRPGGRLVLTTPNVCNLSNVWALMNGSNVFWPPELFYGGLDRHNREFTPEETLDAVRRSGFSDAQMYGLNSHNNWRAGGNELAYEVIAALGDRHPFLRNTTVVLASAG